MNTIEGLKEFLGWCSLINIGLLMLASFFIIAMRKFALRSHRKMFDLGDEDLSRAYLQFLAQYKIVVPIIYADYYYIEACLRRLNLDSVENRD